MTRWVKFGTVIAVVLVVVLAFGLRWRAMNRLGEDFDEGGYLLGSIQIADAIRAGDWSELTQLNHLWEHPQFMKMAYAAALVPMGNGAPVHPEGNPPDPLPHDQFTMARLVSVILGSLEVLLLALLNPLAGFFLAIHTFTIKYTSQIMLEALPAVTSAIVVMAYERSRIWKKDRKLNRTNLWLAISAVALGLTAASKYVYAVAGIAVLLHWLFTALRGAKSQAVRLVLRHIALWGGLSILVFFLVQPYLWPDPVGRLLDSVLFHANYSTGDHVQSAGLPIYQPFVWLTQSVPWHPGVFVISLDLWISILALVGLPRLHAKRPVYVWWLVVGIIFLLLWPTKWSQYIMMITFPLSLAAGFGVMHLVALVVRVGKKLRERTAS